MIFQCDWFEVIEANQNFIEIVETVFEKIEMFNFGLKDKF